MTVTEQAPAQATPVTPVKKTRSWRWLRIAVPFTVLLTLVVGTLVMHSLTQPDPTDPAYAAPSPPAPVPISGTLLAQRLADRGLNVVRMTSTANAIERTRLGNATLFVPAPSLMHRDYLEMLWRLPSTTRVVLVEPSAADFARGGAPVAGAGTRWATKAVPPGDCQIDGLRGAGVAAVFRSAYKLDRDLLPRQAVCYQGAVAAFHWFLPEVVAVGSSDPFLDDQIDEYDNSALAVGLLSQYHDVIWLDVHEKEPGPRAQYYGGDEPPPSYAPEPSDDPGPNDGDDGGAGDPGGGGPGGGGNGNDNRADSGGPSFFDAFPPALWATLVGALLLGVLMALWRARRLGPPVTEPLPFTVKGAETVHGRARLYQRAGAMMTGAQTLRRSVGPQIAQALGLPPTATVGVLVEKLTERYGGDPETYRNLLADDLPTRDSDLVTLAADLDSLLAMVSTPRSAPQGETSG